jgi:hypothetical protein
MLRSIAGSKPKIRKGNGNRIAYRFYTRQHPEITELYRKFYFNREKRIPEDISLDSISMAVWYMDDGSKRRASAMNYKLSYNPVETRPKFIKGRSFLKKSKN